MQQDLFFGFAMTVTAHSLQRQAQVEQEVAEFRDKLPEETDQDTKDKEVNDFRTEAMKKAKQQKAKVSKELKDQAQAQAAKSGATAEAEETPAAKKARASSTTARKVSKGSKLAAGALSAVDEVNRSYYEMVQYDQDTILQHFGASYATEAALAIAAKNSLEGGIQDR